MTMTEVILFIAGAVIGVILANLLIPAIYWVNDLVLTWWEDGHD